MASVDSILFDQPAYSPGSTVTCTVGYTPDTPSVSSQVFTVTANVVDQSGNVVATNTAPFTVNTPQAGDKAAVSDDGSHTWAEQSDNGSVAVFTTAV